MSKFFSVLLFLSLTECHCVDICSSKRVNTMSLALGEGGVLTASNVSHENFANVSFQICRTDIVTCPSCIVSLKFRFLNLSCFCGLHSNLFLHNPCRCDYVWVSEPPYSEASGVSFCKVFPSRDNHEREFTYKSKTRAVRVWFFYSKTHSHAFTLDYKSEKNQQVFLGSCQLNFSTGRISSPFFPAVYPRDLVAEYVLICVKSVNFSSQKAAIVPLDADRTCRVHLTFTDFHLASASVIEFYDGSRRVAVVSGTSFRPPVLISKTNSLSLRFFSFGHTNLGFKAIFSFLPEKNISKNLAKPHTDCGGYVENFGGTIAMVKLVNSHVESFDCVWLIKPLKVSSNVGGYLYLKLIAFMGFVGDAELQIRQGLTSESPVLETLRHPVGQNFQEHVVSLHSGFYVSLRALFGPRTKFVVTYATFTRNKCGILPGFLCKNFRCIEEKLICDGFDHCGDNSDEPSVCNRRRREDSTEDDSKGEIFHNYYFPKVTDYSDAKTAAIVFLVSLVGLVFLTSSVTVALFKVVSKTRRQRNLQEGLHSVSPLSDCLSDELSVEDVVVDDPPSYDPPPNYEEVVKTTPSPPTLI